MVHERRLSTRNLPPELKVLLTLLTKETTSSAAWLGDSDSTNIDWEQVLRLTNHHRIYPTVLTSVRRGLLGNIPVAIEQQLQRQFSLNALNMLQLSAEMIEVSRRFEEQGIPSLMLKGPVIAQALYGDLSLRMSKDLDILVAPEQIEAAESILRERGYQPDDDAPRIINDLKWKNHHVSYTKPDSGIQIELHWRLNPHAMHDSTFEELWSRRQETFFAGNKVFLLGDEDLFVYLVGHGARHGWFRIRWLEDIDKMLRMPLDWQLAISLGQRNECRFLIGQAALLCECLLNTPIPEELLPLLNGYRARRLAKQALPIIRDIAGLSLQPNSKDVNKFYRGYVFATLSFRQKWLFLFSKLYPSSWDAELVPLPKALHFLYFPLRPFLWVWRRLRADTSLTTEEPG